MGLKWDDSAEHAAGARAASGRSAVLAAAIGTGMQAAGLRLAIAALLLIGLLAVLFSNFAALSPSFGAQAPLLPGAAFSVVPDFTPVGAGRPDLQATLRADPVPLTPGFVRLRSARLLDPSADAPASFRRLALADPERICAALRAGPEGTDWGPGQAGFAAFECFSAAKVEADVPMIPMPVAAELPSEEDEGLEPPEVAGEEGLAAEPETEPEMVPAPPKRSLFTIARGETEEAVAFVRMKVMGESPKEAKLAASEAAGAMTSLFETLGWPVPGDAARRIAMLEPVKISDSGTEIVFAREGGADESYNLSILFPDRGAFAGAGRTGAFEPRRSLAASR